MPLSAYGRLKPPHKPACSNFSPPPSQCAPQSPHLAHACRAPFAAAVPLQGPVSPLGPLPSSELGRQICTDKALLRIPSLQSLSCWLLPASLHWLLGCSPRCDAQLLLVGPPGGTLPEGPESADGITPSMRNARQRHFKPVPKVPRRFVPPSNTFFSRVRGKALGAG